MFTVWYFLWNVVFFVYGFFLKFVVRFIFNKDSTVSSSNNSLLTFLFNVHYLLSPINVLNKNKLFSNDNGFSFYFFRSYKFPFLSNITSIFDINTSVDANIYAINFKDLYKEFTFYKVNSSKFSILFNDFSNKYLLSVNESNNLNFLNFVILSKIIYNNFFYNFRRLGFYNNKVDYCYYFNFIFLFFLNKNFKNVKNTVQIDSNFLTDNLNNLSYKYTTTFRIKNLSIDSLNKTPVVLVRTISNGSYVKNLEVYKNYFKLTNNVFVNVYNKWLLVVKENFEQNINSLWNIKFSNSNMLKYVEGSSLNNYVIYYLRKSKVFNKGRYSRNRQIYRTGVYWSLYLNIILMVGLFFWFYRFTLNFGYLWWGLYILIASFIIPRAIKYRLYNPSNLIKSFTADILWLGAQFLIVKNCIENLVVVIINWLKKL